MALRPGRYRSSAAPIIAKGLVYPLQNQRASKLATHGFASKSALHHNKKGTLAVLFCWSAGARRRTSKTQNQSRKAHRCPRSVSDRRFALAFLCRRMENHPSDGNHSYPCQKSPRTKFGEIFTYYLFTFHFSLIPSGRFLAK